MNAGLMVNVLNGRGLSALFHPRLPFTYKVGNFAVDGYWGPSANTISFTWDSPVPLQRPWIRLGGTTNYVGSYEFKADANVPNRFHLTGERGISLIDPRNGDVYYYGEGKDLIAGTTLIVWDIRG